MNNGPATRGDIKSRRGIPAVTQRRDGRKRLIMTRAIRGASVFVEGRLRPLDIVIDGEEIAALVTPGGGPSDAETVDGGDLTAIPGGIDVHVHTRDPGYTHKEDIVTATRAAAAGGYTTIFGMPNVDPPTLRTVDLDAVFDLYAAGSLVDYNHNPAAKMLDQIPAMAERGIAAFKIYMVVDTGRSYPHPPSIGVHDHGELYEAMRAITRTGLRLMVHPHDQQIMDVVEKGFWERGDRSPGAYAKTLAAENGIIWDAATALLLRLAEATGCKLHIVHTQTIRQIEMIADARRRGVDVSAETNHWAIFLGRWSDIEEQGSYALSYWVPEHHQEAVWKAMQNGTIDMLASDHAPHTREEKEVGWTDAWAAHTGTPGIQYQLPLMTDAFNRDQISFARMVNLISSEPARIFGLAKKGTLAPGSDADVVLMDLTREWTITNDSVLSKIGWTPYDGRSIRGAVVRTLVRGHDVWVDGHIVGRPGHGKQAVPDLSAV
ncbi:MAG: amidohydrolase family protein [Acidimicrobiia bacterium]|nr:amidohydrolase family protein [Acidimicrobiia bacterium]